MHQRRCSQMLWASSLRLSAGKVSTVYWMSAGCLRVKRRPKKAVGLSFLISGSLRSPDDSSSPSRIRAGMLRGFGKNLGSSHKRPRIDVLDHAQERRPWSSLIQCHCRPTGS